MSSFYSSLPYLKLTTPNLLRLELLVGFIVVNFFSIALDDFGIDGYGLAAGLFLSSFYMGLFFLSLLFNFSSKQLKWSILGIYTISLLVVLKISIDRSYPEEHYLSFLFIYAFFCFSQSRVSSYSIISGFVFLILISSLFVLDSIRVSPFTLIFSYLSIFITGLAITFSRSYLRNKLVRRQDLLNNIFNISEDGLVLLNLEKKVIVEANQNFLELFHEDKRKSIEGMNYSLLRIGDKHIFKQIDFDRAVSIELRDSRIVNATFKEIEFGTDPMALATVKIFQNKDHLNRSYELDRLLELSEESYKYLFEESSSLICILDQDGTIIDVNKTTTDISDLDKDDLIGRKYDCLDYFNSEQKEERERLNQLAWKGEKQTLEKAIKGKDGRKIDLEVIIQKGKYFGKDVLICNSRDINERKQLERELVKNYDKFIALFELSPIGIISTDLEGKILDFNASFLNSFAYTKERVKNLGLSDIILAEDLDRFKKLKERVEENQSVSEEAKLRFITSDNRTLHCLLNLVLQNNPEGEPSLFICQIVDISTIIEGQNQLEESERSYRELFNNSSELIYLVDMNNRFVDINDKVIQQYGYSKEELMRSGPDILAAPGRNEVNQMQKQVNLALRNDEELNFLFWSKKKNGEIFPKDMKIKKAKYKGQDVMMITGRDISEAYSYREELEEKEKRYRDLFERNLAGVYRTDEAGNILECNQAFARIFGYSSPDSIKHVINANELYIDMQQRSEMIEKLSHKGNVEGWQVGLKRKNGEKIMALLNVSKIQTEDSEYYEGNLIDISELTKTQEQLKLSQQKYQQLIDNSTFGIIIANYQQDILFSNKKAANILAYKNEQEVLDLTLFDIGPGEEDPYLKDLLKRKKSKHLNELREYALIGKNNEPIDVEISPTQVFFDNQPCIQLSFIDISDRKKVERATEKAKVAETFNKILQAELKEKEKAQRKLIDAQSYMEGIIESSLDMIFTTDLDGKINKLNSAAQLELKVTEDGILNKPLTTLFKDNNDAIYVFKQLEQFNSFSGEVDLLRSDQTTFPSYFSLSYLYNSEGVRLGIMGVSKDISEIKAKEVEINKQAAKLNAIIESSSHFFFTIDKKFNVTSFNHVFETDLREKMGIELEVDKNFFEIIPEGYPEKEKIDAFWKEKFERAFSGLSSDFEVKRIAKTGEVYYRDFYLNPIYLDSEEVYEVSGIGHDITEKKRSEEDLKNSLKEKEVLLKEVHHRVKNNMQVISSILSLQSSYLKDEKVLDILRESQNRIKAMAFIHERLYRTKDFSELKFSEYVKSLTESLVSTYLTGKKDLKLDFQIDEVFLNLDCAIPCGLILNELISNALKYAFQGRDSGLLRVALKVDGEGLVNLSVQDDGVGIPMEVDLDNTETLGLQLVHTLTEQLEGQIFLTREGGSKFDLTFSKKE